MLDIGQYRKKLNNMPVPSSFCQPKTWKSIQYDSPLILNHQPASVCGLPITLCHPVFAEFQDNVTTGCVS